MEGIWQGHRGRQEGGQGLVDIRSWINIFCLQALNRLLYSILPKVLGHPPLMKGLTTLVFSTSMNLNV